MNERYLFRGKRKDGQGWIEGDLVHTRTTTQGVVTEIYTLDMSYEVDPETVGQCTGLKDKNGKLIFEGDIVKGLFNFGLDIMSVCTFKDGAFGLTAKQCGAYHFSAFTSLWKVQYEVAGNIHDNPELLENDTKCDKELIKDIENWSDAK